MQGLHADRVTESLTCTKKAIHQREGKEAGKPEGAGTAWGPGTGTPARIQQVPLDISASFPPGVGYQSCTPRHFILVTNP